MESDVLKEFAARYGVAIGMEAKRLSEKYQKDFFDCDDLVAIMGIGKNNIRDLMRSTKFPTTTVGNRKVISVINFVIWQVSFCPEINRLIKNNFNF